MTRAFSSHRFDETFESLAPDANWILVGQQRIEGREAIVATCQRGAEGMRGVETTWQRFLSLAAGDLVAVDAVASYVDPDGRTVVSSCDVYEFQDGVLTTITSYAGRGPRAGAARRAPPWGGVPRR